MCCSRHANKTWEQMLVRFEEEDRWREAAALVGQAPQVPDPKGSPPAADEPSERELVGA
jgi:hypothetical protein